MVASPSRTVGVSGLVTAAGFAVRGTWAGRGGFAVDVVVGTGGAPVVCGVVTGDGGAAVVVVVCLVVTGGDGAAIVVVVCCVVTDGDAGVATVVVVVGPGSDACKRRFPSLLVCLSSVMRSCHT